MRFGRLEPKLQREEHHARLQYQGSLRAWDNSVAYLALLSTQPEASIPDRVHSGSTPPGRCWVPRLDRYRVLAGPLAYW